jgi:hypothetical protein
MTPIGTSSILPGRNGPAASLGAYAGHLVLGAAGPSGAGETRYYEYNGHEVAHYEPDDVPASVEAWSPSSYAGRDGLMTQGYVAVDRYCNSAPDTINGSWEVHQTTPAGIRWSYVAPVRTMACPVNGGPMRVVSLPDGGAVADASGSTSAVGLDLTGFNAAGTIVWTKDLRDATADANRDSLPSTSAERARWWRSSQGTIPASTITSTGAPS